MWKQRFGWAKAGRSVCVVGAVFGCLLFGLMFGNARSFGQDGTPDGANRGVDPKVKDPQAPRSVMLPGDVVGIPERIAFGSCAKQSKAQPILDRIVAAQPDLMIYLGDNIYGDTIDMKVLAAKYKQLGDKIEFQNLRKHVATLSVWDDHDYGWNDAGKEYSQKEASERIFLDFWRVPNDSPRRKHPGIYGEQVFESGGRRLQILMLDTRSFRDPLKKNPGFGILPIQSEFKNDYQPDPDPEKTMLGPAQWEWLHTRLKQPADLRIICSSIQFGHQYNGWESWTNLPAQRQRMLDLITETRANGVLFISGDVHWGEISRRDDDIGYPLYDVTASGLTEEWPSVEPNKFRVGEVCRDNHFGVIEIDWTRDDPPVLLKIIDRTGKTRVQHAFPLSQLRHPDP